MKNKQDIEDRVGVVGAPKITKEVCPPKVGKDIDESSLEGEEHTSDACDGLPAPIVELGKHMCTGMKEL